MYGTSTLFYTEHCVKPPSQVKQRKAMQKQGVSNLVGFDLFEGRVPANARIMPSPNQQFQVHSVGSSINLIEPNVSPIPSPTQSSNKLCGTTNYPTMATSLVDPQRPAPMAVLLAPTVPNTRQRQPSPDGWSIPATMRRLSPPPPAAATTMIPCGLTSNASGRWS